MTALNKRDSSFVLRIWWEEADATPVGRRLWRGWVQHVRSGEACYVQDLEGLLGFIQRWAGKLSEPTSVRHVLSEAKLSNVLEPELGHEEEERDERDAV